METNGLGPDGAEGRGGPGGAAGAREGERRRRGEGERGGELPQDAHPPPTQPNPNPPECVKTPQLTHSHLFFPPSMSQLLAPPPLPPPFLNY